MTIASVLCAFLCGGICAAAQAGGSPVFACNLKAIGVAERPRHNDLSRRLRSAVRDRSELSDGYALKLDGKTISLPEVAEWIAMERLCCPFLTLELSASGNQADWLLKLIGPEGVKPLLRAEFRAR